MIDILYISHLGVDPKIINKEGVKPKMSFFFFNQTIRIIPGIKLKVWLKGGG